MNTFCFKETYPFQKKGQKLIAFKEKGGEERRGFPFYFSNGLQTKFNEENQKWILYTFKMTLLWQSRIVIVYVSAVYIFFDGIKANWGKFISLKEHLT